MTLLRSALAATALVGVLGLGTVGYASIFGEENLTLVRQLSELMGIHRETTKLFRDTREGLEIARDMADDARRARLLVEDLHDYTAAEFIADVKNDVLTTYPDLDAIIRRSSADGLRAWRDEDMRSPMGSYELIGAVFGEATRELRQEQREGRAALEGATLYRYEAAAALTASSDADRFLRVSQDDLETLADALDGATQEEAVVLGAKLQALIAAQNRHILRLLSRSVRQGGVEDARRYRGALSSEAVRAELSRAPEELEALFKDAPGLLPMEMLE